MKRLTWLLALALLCLPVPALAAPNAGAPMTITVGGGALPPAEVASGHAIVPLAALGEALGYRVTADPATGEATLYRLDTFLRFRAGETTFAFNGLALPLPLPVQVKDGQFYVAVRPVIEALRLPSAFDAATGNLNVSLPPAVVRARARALLQKAMAADLTPQNLDGKATFAITIKAEGPGAPGAMEFQMPMELALQVRGADVLALLHMRAPTGNEALNFELAIRDGKRYARTAGGEWAPDHSTTDLPVLEELRSMGGVLPAMTEAMLGADLSLGAAETLGGVPVQQVIVKLSPKDMKKMLGAFGDLVGGMAPQDDLITFERLEFSLWIDPATGFAYRSALGMAASVKIPLPNGGEARMSISMTGGMDAVPATAPIQWPDSLPQ